MHTPAAALAWLKSSSRMSLRLGAGNLRTFECCGLIRDKGVEANVPKLVFAGNVVIGHERRMRGSRCTRAGKTVLRSASTAKIHRLLGVVSPGAHGYKGSVKQQQIIGGGAVICKYNSGEEGGVRLGLLSEIREAAGCAKTVKMLFLKCGKAKGRGAEKLRK